MVGQGLVSPTVVLTYFGIVFAICVLVGRRQRREVDASWRRLVTVAALLALGAVGPLLVACLFGGKLDMSWAEPFGVLPDDQLEEWIPVPDGWISLADDTGYLVPVDREFNPESWFGTGLLGLMLPVNLLVVFFASVTALRGATNGLRPIYRQIGENLELDRVTDEAVVARVRELALRLGAQPPVVFQQQTGAITKQINAATGGLLKPFLIVTDGTLERIDTEETTSVLGHEIGHIARGSVPKTTAILLMVTALIPLLSAFLFPSVTIALMFALPWGLIKILGHHDEIACDRYGARASSHARAATALDKIHGALTLDCGPFLSRIVAATQTHPGRELRLHHLARRAPADQRDEIVYDRREALLQGRTNRVVAAVFVAIISFAVWAGLDEGLKWYGVGGLALSLVSPTVLIVLAVLRRLRYSWQLGYLGLGWHALRGPVLVLASIIVIIIGLDTPWLWPTWIGLAALVWIWLDRRRQKRLNAEIELAVREQDFELAMQLCTRRSPRVQRRPANRTYRATLLAAAGRDGEARQELDSLAKDRPRYWPGQLLRATVTNWSDEAAGFAIVQRVLSVYPNNPYTMGFVAASLSLLERLDEAGTMIDRAISLMPALGYLHGIRSAIARRSGDLDGAEQSLREFESHDPGATSLCLYRAHMLIATGDLVAAGEAVSTAETEIEANRMSLLMDSLGKLKTAYRDALASEQADA